jgi:Taurine catabolism dioxygenase TauD, TfdA family
MKQMIKIEPLHADLEKNGWATTSLSLHTSSTLSESVVKIASTFGNIISARSGAKLQTLSPRSEHDARAATLSRKFGYGELPLHCDTAHWPVPCRYIVLACVTAGCVEAPTILLDSFATNLSDEEHLLTRSASFIVRNGRNSFYANLIDRDRPFIRIDPGCMEPAAECSIEAMRLYSYERQRGQVAKFHWKAGDVLIVDNWRMLHGRGNTSVADPNRRLLRAYVQ